MQRVVGPVVLPCGFRCSYSCFPPEGLLLAMRCPGARVLPCRILRLHSSGLTIFPNFQTAEGEALTPKPHRRERSGARFPAMWRRSEGHGLKLPQLMHGSPPLLFVLAVEDHLSGDPDIEGGLGAAVVAK